MKKLVCKKVIFLILFITIGISAFSQQYFFKDVAEAAFKNTLHKRVVIPSKFRTISLDKTAFLNFLQTVPAAEKAGKNLRHEVMLEIPMPKGDTSKFYIWESSVMAPELAAKFPGIKSYTGQGITDGTATIKIDWTELGFHAMILSPVTGSVFIDPYAQGNTIQYISYFKSDLKKNVPFVELEPVSIGAKAKKLISANNILAGQCRGTQIYSYRLAVACTHQYAVAATGFANPTVGQTLGAIATTMSRVNGVYEKELSITMVLVGSEQNIIFTTAARDPFTGDSNGDILIAESQKVIDSAIGTNNYDIGHTFSSNGGGQAIRQSVCDPASKAGGITGSPNPSGDGYNIDYVAHEMGHQFGANHTFNSLTEACNLSTIAPATAYEPGSATTIMGYAGICGSDDIQPNSDAFFHAISFDEISDYLQSTGGGCATVTTTTNVLPQITAMNNNGANIPLETPFILSGAATDANSDALTYSWEEWDLGDNGPWNNGENSTTAPLFKARLPKTTGSRTFPDISVILAGYPPNPGSTTGGLKGETLPAVARPIKFRLTVRDNRAGGGGVVSGGSGCQTGFSGVFQINTVAATGPFIVTAPNGGEIWGTNTAQTVKWNTAGTAASPINCTTVTIQLSTDGGNTYPITLLANTPNDGSQQVVMPATITNTARIRIMADNNIFFAISDSNFRTADPYITITNGNWNLPATWQGGVVPTTSVEAIVRHTVTVTANTGCYSLTVQPAGSVSVNPGVQLNITH